MCCTCIGLLGRSTALGRASTIGECKDEAHCQKACAAAQEMDSSGSLNPSRQLLWRCCYIFGAEILIDVTKHAVLAKLNDIRPNVYQRFMKVRARPLPP